MVVERYENTIPRVRVSQIKSGRVILRKRSSRASLIAPERASPFSREVSKIDFTRSPRRLEQPLFALTGRLEST
jgi:hypothetical protein